MVKIYMQFEIDLASCSLRKSPLLICSEPEYFNGGKKSKINLKSI